MNIWKFSIVFVSVAIVHLSKINADEEAASVATATEGVSSSVYPSSNDVASYADAYAQYYAQYLPDITANHENYYQSYLRNAQKYANKPSRKQGYNQINEMMTDVLGPEAALTLGLIGSLMGVVSLIGLAVNANSISSLSTDQDSICTTVKDIGNAALTSISATTEIDSDAERMVVFNNIITEINSYATPSC